jgi:hypothetical protein
MRSCVLALAILAGVGLAACATDSYHAYEAGEGYSEQRLAEARWRVSFDGATYESQAAVEERLLRRAAELTVQSGYDWFAPVDQAVEEDIVVTGERTAAPAVNSAETVWRPRWRRRSASRWTDWDPQGALPTAQTAQASTTSAAPAQRFSASAEINMGRGAAPAAAIDARAVLNRTHSAD